MTDTLAEYKLLYFVPFRLHRILHLLENSVVVKGSKQKDLQVSLIILVYVRESVFKSMLECDFVI